MNMKNFLKKLHITSNNQSEDGEGSTSSRGSKSSDMLASPDKTPLHAKSSQQFTELKPFSGLSGWLNSVTNRHSSPTRSSSPNVARIDQPNLGSNVGSDVAGADILGRASGCNDSRDPDVEEEYQIQLALELSAREDPEAVQIEAVKQISLGSCPPDNTPAEIVAFRYWNYHSLSYDDKIMDGFYDLYGVMSESTTEKMPSLVDLQGIPVSNGVTWEAVLVNRAADANLDKLEQKALALALKSRLGALVSFSGDLVRKIASVVSDNMGGPVANPENMLKSWQKLSYSLKDSIGSMVLPLGSLTIGLARHRALLFKVLADSVGIPCRLVKGHQYTGSDGVAMCFVKTEDGREYIVDLMADPGTLIPSDAAGSHIDYNESFVSTSQFSSATTFTVASSSSGLGSSSEDPSEFGLHDKKSNKRNVATAVNKSDERSQLLIYNNVIRENKVEDVNVSSDSSSNLGNVNNDMFWDLPSRPNFPYTHGRSPSWTEGVSSPAVRRMKVKDVSQYMIDAAKENPQLAQKLHDVLLESGVVAPANLFAEVLPEEFEVVKARVQSQFEVKVEKKNKEKNQKIKGQEDHHGPVRFLPPLPNHGVHTKPKPKVGPEYSKFAEDVEINHRLELNEASAQPILSHAGLNEARYVKNVPVAAAAAAAAAVVASSMVVAAAKSSTESTVDLPVAAAATATAAAVVATTACLYQSEFMQSDEDHHDVLDANVESDRVSDKSTGNESVKSDAALDDVSDCEIPWDEIAVGERIGLGSYGEVYRGDWHGTEVAVKRFLEQDISGESLEEFRSEIRIMKRLRHPNVVLFMGAVTRAPNLSIITEFLPRGSLYRLIHRPNNHLDARRRLKMAFDAARGMNYLHSSTPVIVHRDLKSPNLLVDKNWVVKVCDFGLSRMKHSTYLSSRSTAGTAEWMAPEVLRNEPSDEKCDVYSYGVILWELSTMQQPWGGMNPMQVVGAVGFQHRRLDIPDDMDPAVADIIKQCWQTDPKLRPTFTEIMAALKPLQKPITSQLNRSSA